MEKVFMDEKKDNLRISRFSTLVHSSLCSSQLDFFETKLEVHADTAT